MSLAYSLGTHQHLATAPANPTDDDPRDKAAMRMQRLLRFRLRTLFLAVAVVACFLAWRLRDVERPAIDAIAKAGGQVHFGFQSPMPSYSSFSVGMLPNRIYFSQLQITRHGAAQPPRPSFMEFVLGSDPDRCVTVVELKLEDMSPTMIDHLKSLKHLQHIVLDMPRAIVSQDSLEAQRLAELKREFGGKLAPAYDLGLPTDTQY